MWLLALVVVLGIFALTVFRGAPYVPTHRRQIQLALDQLKPNDTILDLGSGDGAILKAAALRGHQAYGFEINPLLCLVSWLRCLRVRHLVRISWRDFWLVPITADIDTVFVFAGGPFMKHLARKLQKDTANRAKPLQVISYGFTIPGEKPRKVVEGLYIYWYD